MPESLMEMTKSKHKGHLQNPVLLKEKPPKFLCLCDLSLEWLKTSTGGDGSSADKQEENSWNTQKQPEDKPSKKTPKTLFVFLIVKSHNEKATPPPEEILQFSKFNVHDMKSNIIFLFSTSFLHSFCYFTFLGNSLNHKHGKSSGAQILWRHTQS